MQDVGGKHACQGKHAAGHISLAEGKSRLPSHHLDRSREFLPLILITRNRLKYALTYREVISILMQRHVLVIGKFRTDKTYPAGFMVMFSTWKMSFPFPRLVRTTGFSMTPRIVSAFNASGTRMPSSSCARFSQSSLVRRAFHT